MHGSTTGFSFDLQGYCIEKLEVNENCFFNAVDIPFCKIFLRESGVECKAAVGTCGKQCSLLMKAFSLVRQAMGAL